jgi:hypothetical protein
MRCKCCVCARTVAKTLSVRKARCWTPEQEGGRERGERTGNEVLVPRRCTSCCENAVCAQSQVLHACARTGEEGLEGI